MVAFCMPVILVILPTVSHVFYENAVSYKLSFVCHHKQ
jgi:hypothetical protein